MKVYVLESIPFLVRATRCRCSFAERCGVTNVACGYGFTVFALKSKKYHIMGTGINSDGQLGAAEFHFLCTYTWRCTMSIHEDFKCQQGLREQF